MEPWVRKEIWGILKNAEGILICWKTIHFLDGPPWRSQSALIESGEVWRYHETSKEIWKHLKKSENIQGNPMKSEKI